MILNVVVVVLAPAFNLLFIKLITVFLCSWAFADTFCFSWNKYSLLPCLEKFTSAVDLSHYLLLTFWIAFGVSQLKVSSTQGGQLGEQIWQHRVAVWGVKIYTDFIRVNEWRYRFVKQVLRCVGLDILTYIKNKNSSYLFPLLTTSFRIVSSICMLL